MRRLWRSRSLDAVVADDLGDLDDDVFGILASTGLPSTIWVKVMLSASSCVTDTLRSILCSVADIAGSVPSVTL